MSKGSNWRGGRDPSGPNRGQGGGRGGARGRGRGGGRGRGLVLDPGPGPSNLPAQCQWQNELDFVIHPPQNNHPTPKRPGPKERAKQKQANENYNSGFATPSGGSGRGSGAQTPDYRRRGGRGGRGLGSPEYKRGPSRLNPSSAPLSALLYAERPLLRPVIFVRSVHTATLFQDEADILQTTATPEAEEQSHVPTADRITRIFSASSSAPPPHIVRSTSPSDEELEEVDFSDLAILRAQVDALAEQQGNNCPPSNLTSMEAAVEQPFTGFYADTTPFPDPPPLDMLMATEESEVGQQCIGFYVDTTPAPIPSSTVMGVPEITDMTGQQPLGSNPDPEDDDVIVYEAPYQRVVTGLCATSPAAMDLEENISQNGVLTNGVLDRSVTLSIPDLPPQTPTIAVLPNDQPRIPSPPPFSSISFSFGSGPSTPQPRLPLGAKLKHKTKARQQKARAQRRKRRNEQTFGSFASFGAILEEGKLWNDGRDGKDPRWEERRKGDSDVDWGDESDEKAQERAGAEGGMNLDPDLDLDLMKRFVKGMSVDGGHFVTMGDIEDEEKMRLEDEAREEWILDGQERIMVGESCSEDEGGSDLSDSDGVDAFRTKLERVREKARGKRIVDAVPSSADDSDVDDGDARFAGPWDDGNNLLGGVQAILDENDAIIHDFELEHDSHLFRAVHNGNFNGVEGFGQTAVRAKDKGNTVPPELQDRWAKDRAKKAENKRLRALACLAVAADPFVSHKGGKKGRKAMLAAARVSDSTIAPLLPERITDMKDVVAQIRVFTANLGGAQTMALPPMQPHYRKCVHDLALAFGLSSKSKGKGDGRYTTLSKTTRTGFPTNEHAVTKILRIAQAQNFGGARDGGFQKPTQRDKGKGKVTVPRHRDGDEVGKAAPKIGESNIGFRLLASMGWQEGDRIGLSGGLDAPLTAVIKNSKLGLGATR